MLKSMTGFGKEEADVNEKNVSVEIRSLNSKQLDVNLKIAQPYKAIEPELRAMLASFIERGRVDVFIDIEQTESNSAYSINHEVYKKFLDELMILSSGKLNEKELLPVIMKFPDVFRQKNDTINDDELKNVMQLAQKAIEKLDSFRINEGKVLETDILKRVNIILDKMGIIEKHDNKRIESVKEKLILQLKALREDSSYDPNRFEQELIYYLEKFDITEEKIRLKKHCDYFITTLKEEQSTGKKLAFITQEMGREINTIGSKANNFEIQKTVVEMKDELEKVKEQLGNVL
ncbi:MAG: YicC family protein [Bacteroidales bacterium]|nr:YicC family protein [Bacteroidales bacterium]